MTEISKRTSLLTSSLGSGSGGDIIYLFQNDTPATITASCTTGNIHMLNEEICDEHSFNDAKGLCPKKTTTHMQPREYETFLERLEKLFLICPLN